MYKTLRRTTLMTLLFCTLLAGAASAESIVLSPVADTWLRGGAPKRAFGESGMMAVGKAGQPDEEQGLVAFDLSALPAGSVIVSAQLRLMPRTHWARVDAPQSRGLFVSEYAAPWTEKDLSWNKSQTVKGGAVLWRRCIPTPSNASA